MLQEKAALKTAKDAADAKFKTAKVDGRQEQVSCTAQPAESHNP